ncbi:MAG: hypothetical protein R3E12_06360 [Candidatus Eisenbacteria bacterium]
MTAALEHLLDREVDLTGVDRLGQVVGDLAAERQVHQVLFFALGDEDHRQVGMPLLDRLQSREAAHPGHHLVQQNDVERLLLGGLDRVFPVRDRLHLVPFAAEIEDVRPEHVDLVVGPEDALVGFVVPD